MRLYSGLLFAHLFFYFLSYKEYIFVKGALNIEIRVLLVALLADMCLSIPEGTPVALQILHLVYCNDDNKDTMLTYWSMNK